MQQLKGHTDDSDSIINFPKATNSSVNKKQT